MSKSPSDIIPIEQEEEVKLSSVQKQFKRLMQQVEAKRTLLQNWQTMLPVYKKKYNEEFEPLVRDFNQLRIAMVHTLDAAHDNPKMTEVEKGKLQELLTSLLTELLAVEDNDELKALYTKYTGGDFDGEMSMENARVRKMFEKEFGLDLGEDFDLRSPEDAIERVNSQMQERMAAIAEQEEKASKKKSAKQLAREAKKEEEAQKVSQSLREVFRKLASVLHPDRAKDDADRERCTELMQRANIAYEKNDLLTLLELQLEAEQVDVKQVSTMSDETVKNYNKILSEQIADLQMEIEAIETDFCLRYRNQPATGLTPARVLRELDGDIVYLKSESIRIQNDLEIFKNLQELKDWLGAYSAQGTADDMGEPPTRTLH